ncbi:MAG: zinc-binding alcohol dehydrogenase family protein [Caldilineaceae bacterium]|nr:zinc-binding alcohol dehydrogenase family protein [Caldilineaceae bacterium]
MLSIVLDQPGHFRLAQAPEPPAPGPGEVLVRVGRVGICGTDLHAFRGRQPFFSYPRILGHELGVEVVALGPETEGFGLAVGDRCAVEPYLNCGKCIACRRGRTNCCERLQVLGVHRDGGMVEWLMVPAHKLHRSLLPLEHLALVEMLCIGAHAVSRAQLLRDEQVLVVGAGPIGLATTQFAKLSGADVAVMEISPARREFCRDHLGISRLVDPQDDAVVALQSAFDGELPTVVFDATGSAQSMASAFRYVANSGKLVYVGLVQGDITFGDPEFHRREMTLFASRNATGADFHHVIDALESGRVNIAPWITHRSVPDTFIQDFPTWLEPERGVVKAMLEL